MSLIALIAQAAPAGAAGHAPADGDFWGLLFVFVLASFIGMGVIRRVSRLLHTPLMSITNAISAIAVVGAIMLGRSWVTPAPEERASAVTPATPTPAAPPTMSVSSVAAVSRRHARPGSGRSFAVT